MSVRDQQVHFHGWPNCRQLSNGVVDLIVTADVGPRIIRFGFTDGGNEFAEFADLLGKTGGEEWRIYGGHRLWHAPEEMPRTYYPDNRPVTCSPLPDGLRVVQEVESTTGIQKEMDISLAAATAEAHIVHRLRNRGAWPVTLAPWALTVMAPGGTAILPLPPHGPHNENLRPVGTLTLWAYSDLSDPRWTWGRSCVLLKQDMHRLAPLKIGHSWPAGWLAYWREGHLFVKRYTPVPDAVYPDFGSVVELFTDDQILELETLGPLVSPDPGESVEHREIWSLQAEVPPIHTEADVLAHVLPLVSPAT